jgi:hypothetical protein
MRSSASNRRVRKTLPLLALAAFAAGCGHSYTDVDARRALGSSSYEVGTYRVDDGNTVFATLASVTQLAIEETPQLPKAVYQRSNLFVERYGNADEAWVATHSAGWTSFPGLRGHPIVVRRVANLVLFGARDRVDAALARLH